MQRAADLFLRNRVPIASCSPGNSPTDVPAAASPPEVPGKGLAVQIHDLHGFRLQTGYGTGHGAANGRTAVRQAVDFL